MSTGNTILNAVTEIILDYPKVQVERDRLKLINKQLLEACKEWMKYESEMPGVHPCPDKTMRAVYRKKAVELSKAVIADAIAEWQQLKRAAEVKE